MSLRRSSQLFLVALLCIAFVGCVGVRGRRGEPEHSGFLGDYSKLKHREGFEAEVWINPDAVWTRYDSIELDSVTLWAVDKQTDALTGDERQMLSDLLYKALHDKLGSQFTLTDQAGPRTLRIRAALTQAKGANVPLRTLTTLVPQALVLGMAAGISTDTARTVGTATVEIEILDSVTHKRLAAAIDSRAGTKSLVSSRTFKKWGDVQAAANFWASRVTRAMIRMGVRRKPDPTELES